MIRPPVKRALLDIPTWNQLRDPLPDGQQDPFSSTDCGWECVAMRVWYRTGIALPAGQYRALSPTNRDRGSSTPGELVKVMRLFGLRPVALSIANDVIEGKLLAALSAGVPPIVLGYWELETELHYILGVQADQTGLLVNDPWGGRRDKLSWRQVAMGYAGWCIL